MLLEQERKLLVQYGRKMAEKGLVGVMAGNLSTISEDGQFVAISPSGIDYFETEAEDIVILDRKGTVVDGHRNPSSETDFHLSLYDQRESIRSVVHTHAPYTTTVACLGRELPPIHYMIAASGDKVPLAPYATYGTPELAKLAADHIGDYNALLLKNHGMITVGPSVADAFKTTLEIEFVARIYCQTLAIGEPSILTKENIQDVAKQLGSYGQD